MLRLQSSAWFGLFLVMGASACDDGNSDGGGGSQVDATVGRTDGQRPAPDRALPDQGRPPQDAAPIDQAVAPLPDAAPVDMALPPEDQGRPPADMGCVADEICGNGLDDDCNGSVDDPDLCEVRPDDCMLEAPCATGLLGVCAQGTSRCPNGPRGGVVCDPLEVATAERCEGALDEDCDGTVDETFELGVDCTVGLGVCAGQGQTVCGPDGDVTCSGQPVAARVERCDGRLDEDCDGQVDEGFVGLGTPCTVGDGVCQAEGRTTCSANGQGTRCDARPGGPGSEVCNGGDDDCDLAIDEAFPELGRPCVLGQGACRAEGIRVCFSGDRTYCNAVQHNPVDETCNGIDDDCDGVTDEDGAHQPISRPCYGGAGGTLGVGLCRGGRQLCNGGAFGGCENEVRPQDEACDGQDQDCDGRVDEAEGGGSIRFSCYAGAAGTANVGACRSGNRTCRNGLLSGCEGQVLPRGEFCDDADNDCNGSVDDVGVGGCNCAPGVSRNCYSGPANTQNVGSCVTGRQSCRPDGTGYGPCQGEVTPDIEVCDGGDDDCDGRTDEDIDGVGQACNVGQGACQGVGVLQCDPARGARCSVSAGAPGDEVCNGTDDDCDGGVDERFRLGEPCRLGIGACAREGEVVCAAGGAGSECSVQPAAPQVESCDAIDNDCDGRTDEGLNVGLGCEVGVGACLAGGVFRCGGDGQVVCSVQARAPQAERCDGRDNDCDGRTDEAFNLGVACVSGEGNCQAQGLTRCSVGGGVECTANVGQGVVERCDGFDNDCDGTVDENYALGVACEAGIAACRVAGVSECAPDGRLGCSARPQEPVNEACDARDNDCDGRIDEGFNVGAGCQAGAGVCQAAGVFQCVAGAAQCSAVAGPPGAETCEGQDNDCDGRVDEGFGTGQVCSAGVGACRQNGLTRCTAQGAFGCSVQGGAPVQELCDVIDNDCDGRTDEGFNLGQFCSLGAGICRRDGVTRCGAGQVICSAIPAQGQAETCDNRDEDCDGRTDEGFAVGVACEVGVGECLSQGTTRCSAGGAIECGVPAGQARVELCDGRDNDCDGRVDETFNVGQACQSGAGLCLLNGVLACGANQQAFCSGPPPAGRAELCNATDDDCDGRVDEGAGVCPDLEPPVITLLLEPILVLFDGNARVTVTVRDDRDPAPVVTVTVGGAPVQLDQNGQYLYRAVTPGPIPVVVVAIDNAGRRSEARDTFRVQDLNDNTAPIVRILSPADTTEITQRTPIRGRLEDANFFRFTLEMSLDQQTWTVLNTGNQGGANVLVGELDPTLLPPGLVHVRLTGEDVNSLNQFQIVSYRIPQGASIGETKISVRDFHMPLKGIPVTFDRSYDSRRKFQSGDFGFGWQLATANALVTEDLQSNVMVALPDGRREYFGIRYNFPGFFPFGTMDYLAVAGVFSTLTTNQGCAVVNTQAGVLCFDTGRPPAFSVSNYVLTTLEGTRYEMSDVNGLQRITDREGNQITFADDAIRSNLGVEVTWARDPQGRITALSDPRGGVIEYRYDARGNLSEVVDQEGGVQRYTYNDDHGLIGVTGADGNPVVRTEYDADGRKVRDIDPIGGETRYAYDLDGRRQTVTNRNGDVIVYEYNVLGQVTRRVDELGNPATFEFNAQAQLTRETLPDGSFFGYAYDARGKQSRITLPSGRANSFTYNIYGQPLTLTNPLNHRLTLGYDAAGRMTTVTNASGDVRTIEYDATGNRSAITDADGARTDIGYDPLGNITDLDRDDGFARRFSYNEASQITAIEDSDGDILDLDYDGVGRLTQVTDALGGRILVARDGLGRITRLTDVDGSVRRLTYDPRGLIASVTDPLGSVTRYTYNPEGKLMGVTHPVGGQTAFTRDARGNITQRQDALGGASTWQFDGMGRVIRRTPRGAEPIVFEYSPSGMLTRKVHPIDGVIVFEYDDVDRMVATQGPEGRTTLQYDTNDRLTSEQVVGGPRIQHSWDPSGRRLSMTGPDGVTQYGYTDQNRLTEIMDPVLNRFVLERGPEGHLTRMVFPNGITVTYTYDANDCLTRWEARNAGGILAFETNTHDAAGRVTRIDREGNRRVELTYDLAGQLTRFVFSTNGVTSRDVTYTYDANGSRTGQTTNGVVSQNVLDADMRLTRDGTFTYRYDPEGNLVEKTRIDGASRETFAYDSERHMTAYRRFNAQAAEVANVGFVYNARGQRVARIEGGERKNITHAFSEQTWVQDAQGALVERFVHGDQIDQVLAVRRPNGAFFFVLDGRGDVAAAFDNAGALVGRYHYDGFGGLVSQDGAFDTPVGFGGRPKDPTTGLYDFRSRAYDPATGRFMQQDPEVGRLTDPITIHPYLYAANSPYLFRDPLGRATAVSYAFLTSRFVSGSGSVSSPNVYEMGGAMIGFMHGFGAGALLFLGAILELANNGEDIMANWGAAVDKTAAELDRIAAILSRMSAIDPGGSNGGAGFPGAFVGGAGISAGFSIKLKVPDVVDRGIKAAGGKNGTGEKIEIVKAQGGFKNGGAEFLNFVRQLGPQ